jgi:hypothetical protein
VVSLLGAALAVVVPVNGGGRDCGIVRTVTNDVPQDASGNFDAACLEAYQRRWLVISVLVVAGIALLLASTRALAQRELDSRGRVASWIGVLCVSGGAVLPVLLAVELGLAQRGGY